ncbi:dethiobiotin synthase [Francisella frigiditurris]|uniref:ATP-dependent dethiobiotin synthetase BioD n=1 Tax=Francisella frigiditurris TaxID=1542390 RepID=A0A1J0KUJ1_9GAMM|nr:dethiobiotin synthase [Francisella frigiditurris]APC97437.1 dethiobiotin synthase [Francisella frigiditurris]
MKKVFIIGTDTEVGKTYISTNLIKAYEHQNIKSLCLKPVASGKNEGYDLAEDVESIYNAYNQKYSPKQINCISFDEAVAPHIAAKKLGIDIKLESLKRFIEINYSKDYDILLIEGAGGLLTPYSNIVTQLDLIKSLNIPVLLVSSIKIGCINHTLLTLNELENNNIKCLGWVANCDKNVAYIDEQIQTIKAFSKMKCLAKIKRYSGYLDFIELSKILISPDEKE